MTVHPGPQAQGEMSHGVPLPGTSEPPSERRGYFALGDVEPRSRGPRSRRPLAALLVCAVLGGITGLILSVTGPHTSSAVTMLTFSADPAIPGQQDVGGQGVTDRFIQTQILLLTGADVRDAVAKSLGQGSELMLSAQQVGATDVVRLEVEAETAEAAKTASTAVIQQYDDQRRAAFTSRVDGLLQGLDVQIAELEAQVESGGEGALSGSQTTEYSRLLALRNQLALLSTGSNSLTRVVDQPRTEPQGGPASVLKALAVGTLIGAVAGAALALLLERFRSV